MSPSVVVVGAGPTGLALAAELATRGVRCTVLERRATPPTTSRAFGLEPRTLELLDLRGQAERVVEAGVVQPRIPLGDGRTMLDYGLLDTPFPFTLALPQRRTEDLLHLWCVEAGAEVVRGAEVVGLDARDDGVVVEFERDGRRDRLPADAVVGCDGVRSRVRELAGIPFDGRDYPQSLVIADVRLARPPAPLDAARIGRHGMVAAYPLGDDVHRLIVLDHRRMALPKDEPVTLEELADSCRAILGRDPGPHSPQLLSRYRSSQRHARSYRRGRVLLAGDAAHTHIPSGGQGLQVGIADAFNLGWKLAAHLHGWAPPGLLDSYERERLPIARATLRKTDLSFRFETARGPVAALLRRALAASMRFRPAQRANLAAFAGFDVRYPRLHPDDGGLAGTRFADRELRLADGSRRRVHELLRDGRFLLLERVSLLRAPSLDQRWGDRVHRVELARDEHPDLPAEVLVRPDAHVAWSRWERHLDAGPLVAALGRWAGPPGAAGRSRAGGVGGGEAA